MALWGWGGVGWGGLGWVLFCCIVLGFVLLCDVLNALAAFYVCNRDVRDLLSMECAVCVRIAFNVRNWTKDPIA
jgi:hypothetical protein